MTTGTVGSPPAGVSIQAITGMALVAVQNFSAAANVSVDNCFSSAYANYRVVITLDGSAANTISLRMRAAGVDASGANYYGFFIFADSLAATVTGSAISAATSLRLGTGSSATSARIIADIANPQVALPTLFASVSPTHQTVPKAVFETYQGSHSLSTSYDGFTLIPNSSTLSGTVRVYGYQNTTGVGVASPGSDTQVLFNDAGTITGDAGLTYNKTTDVLSVTGGVGVGIAAAAKLHLAAGSATASTAPLKLTAGTSLTTPEAGAIEFDGANWLTTANTTSGRADSRAEHTFALLSNGSAIGPTIADVFGATSSITLPASSVWEWEAVLYFTKTTAGTVTFTITNSAANYTNIAAHYHFVANGGMVAGLLVGSTAAAAALPATVSLAVGDYAVVLTALIEMNAAGNVRLRATQSAGTITPLRGSRYKIRRLPGNTGAFVA